MDFAVPIDDDGDELFFEGPDEAPAPAATTAPATPEPAKPPRKRGRAKPLPAPVEAIEPAATDPATEGHDPAPEAGTANEPIVASGSPGRLVMVAVTLAAIASLFSAVGLLVASRNVAALTAARDDAERREQALARLPGILSEVDRLVAAQRVELARAAAVRPADIVTRQDLVRELDGLRYALSRVQAPGTTALAGVVRAGQTELSGRLDDLEAQVESIRNRDAAHAARR